MVRHLMRCVVCAMLSCLLIVADNSPAAEKLETRTDVSRAVTKALDFLADEVAKDPRFEKTPRRKFYGPIIYAPLSGLAFLGNGSTREEGRYSSAVKHVLAYVMQYGGKRKEKQDAINKVVGANICSLTHNAGFNAMFLAQLIDSEAQHAQKEPPDGLKRKTVKLQFSEAQIRQKLRECCKTLEEIQSNSGGWQHGSGGPNALGYTHLMASTVTAMNGLAMAKQVGVKVDSSVFDQGLDYIRKASRDGYVGYAVNNRGSFSVGRNAGVLQIFYRLGLQNDELVKPVVAKMIKNLGKAETGHGSPVWHLFYAGLATAHLSGDASRNFDSLYRRKLLQGQQEDGSIRAPEKLGTKPGHGEENRVWGAFYTTPLIVLTLEASSQPKLLLYDFRKYTK